MPVIAITEIFGIAGRRTELVGAAHPDRAARARVAGSRRYVFAARLRTPDQFVLISEWDSQEAMAAYHRSEQFARYQFERQGLLARPSEMTIYSVTDTVRPVPSGPPDPRDAD